MHYLKHLEPLNNSITFLDFIKGINEGFIMLDRSEYEFYLANSQSFELTIPMWLHKCKDDEDRRLYKGFMMPLQAFAIHKIIEVVNSDLLIYQQNDKKDSKLLYKDIQELASIFKTQTYLANISGAILKHLEQVQMEFISNSKNFKMKNIVGQDSNDGLIEGEDYLIWNGSITQLCTLFHDFRTTKTNGKAYLDYVPEQLVQFIIKHFRQPDGEEFSYNTIKTNLDPNREDKKAKKGRLLIPEE